MDNKNGYYIDGKKQAIELLQHLEGEERNKLLKNIDKKKIFLFTY